MPSKQHLTSRRDRRQYRIGLLVSLAVLIPAGYWVRFASPGPAWLRDLLGTVAYETFWIALVACLRPGLSPALIAVGVFIATCGIEFLQLLQSPFWVALRSTLLGRLIFGNTFTWIDFPAYAAGSAFGWAYISALHRLLQRSRS
ncbi:MAG: DUF2809 domain-containing protein [Elainellaceae cyanobacterium]